MPQDNSLTFSRRWFPSVDPRQDTTSLLQRFLSLAQHASFLHYSVSRGFGPRKGGIPMSDHREFLGTPCIAFIAFPAACLSVAGSLTGCSSSSSPSTTPPPVSGVVNFVYTANAARTPSTVSR